MPDISAGLRLILAKYASDTTPGMDCATPLRDLGIDDLDFDMIVLDVEDAFDVSIEIHGEMSASSSVGDVADGIAKHLAIKAAGQGQRATPRAKRGWMSSSIERGR